MKILVTGSSGFIGSHLVSELIAKNHEVLGVDSYTNYYSPEYKKARRDNLKKLNGNFIDHEMDVADYESFVKLIYKIQPDAVIHLAGQPGVRIAKGEFSAYSHANLEGFSSLLSAAIINEIPNLLFASSSSVYGNSTDEKLSEDQKNLTPISFYGATKLSNEILAESISADSNIRMRALRFFTVYGNWGRPDMAYFRIARALRKDGHFPQFGQAQVLRDFTHVSDTVRQIELLMNQLTAAPRNFYDVVNIGGGQPRSLTEMITTLEKLSGRELKTNLLPGVVGDVKVTNSSSVYRESLVGASDFKPLEEGLEELYAWISSQNVEHLLDAFGL